MPIVNSQEEGAVYEEVQLSEEQAIDGVEPSRKPFEEGRSHSTCDPLVRMTNHSGTLVEDILP